MTIKSLEIRSKITSDAKLEVWLEEVTIPHPKADEVVVRIDAAPLNPSDLSLLLGPIEASSIQSVGTAERPKIVASVAADQLPSLRARLDQAMPVGNEGAGEVIAAGADAQHLLGRLVSTRSAEGTYAQYRLVKAASCIPLPEHASARDGASAFINPLTALGMIETLHREGHSALIHTAAASNLGQMLNRLCIQDKIPLVNIVRSQAQAEILQKLGAQYIINSSEPSFKEDLAAAVAATNATLAFDAIGGGTLAGTLLQAMETAQQAKESVYSRYGSQVHKQVYIYGRLDTSPRLLEGNFGMAWGIGGWLLTWYYQKLDTASVQRLQNRVVNELTTTFASHYTAEISLAEALDPEIIHAYSRRATGEKYLIRPNS